MPLFASVRAALVLAVFGVGAALGGPGAPGSGPPPAGGPVDAGPSPGGTLATEVREAADLEFLGPVSSAAGFSVTLGRLSVRFDSGLAGRVRDGHGLVGVVLSGRGVATYQEDDPAARSAFAWNLAHATSLSLRDGRMSCRLKRAVLLWPGGLPASLASDAAGVARQGAGAAPQRPAPAVASPSGDEATLAGVLSNGLSEWTRTKVWDFPVWRTLAREGGNASGETFAWLDGKETLAWSQDEAGRYRLMALKTGDSAPRAVPLRSDRGEPMPREGWSLVQADLDMEVGAAPSLGIRARLRLQPRHPAATERGAPGAPGGVVALSLTEARELRQAEFVNPGYGFAAEVVNRMVPPAVRVRAVSDGHGRPLEFVHAHETLLVRLPAAPPAPPPTDAPTATGPSAGAEPGPARAPAEIEVDLDTDLARRPAGYEYFTLRAPGWFPIPVNQQERFGFSWRIRSPEPMRPVTGSAAEPLRPASEAATPPQQGTPAPVPAPDPGSAPAPVPASTYLVEQSLPFPVRQPLLACGKYVGTQAVGGRTPVRVWSYARTNPQGEAIARFSAAAVAFDETLLGRYPFPVLDVVETAPGTGGQSGPGILLIEGIDPADLARQRRAGGALAFNMTFAHEIAHQWWGQSVSWKSGRDEWLFEALAEYTGWLFVRTLKGNLGELAERQWLVRAQSAAGATSIAEADGLTDDTVSRRARANLIYGKGALLLRRLALETGEESFHAALAAFAREMAGREADAAAFVDSVSRSTGHDLRPLFAVWANGVGLPETDGPSKDRSDIKER